MTERNQLVDLTQVPVEETGADTDAAGRDQLVVDELRSIPSVAHVHLHTPSGYVINPVSVDGNQVTYEVRQGGGADSQLALVDGSSIDIDINGTVEGQ